MWKWVHRYFCEFLNLLFQNIKYFGRLVVQGEKYKLIRTEMIVVGDHASEKILYFRSGKIVRKPL